MVTLNSRADPMYRPIFLLHLSMPYNLSLSLFQTLFLGPNFPGIPAFMDKPTHPKNCSHCVIGAPPGVDFDSANLNERTPI